jgi:hypothetical protein
MAMTSIKFYGLCGIGKINGVWQAAMPAVDNHRAILAIRVKEFDIKHSTEPDILFHDKDGRQLAGWDLGTKELEFTGATGAPEWNEVEQARMINLPRFHPGATMKSPSSAAVVFLPAGDLTAGTEPLDLATYKVFKGKNQIANEAFPVSVVWEGAFTTLAEVGSPKGLVKLKDGAVATVTNVMPSTGGDQHFHLYYDEFFVPKLDKADQITIEIQGARGTALNVEVFDCVPAVPLP